MNANFIIDDVTTGTHTDYTTVTNCNCKEIYFVFYFLSLLCFFQVGFFIHSIKTKCVFYNNFMFEQ